MAHEVPRDAVGAPGALAREDDHRFGGGGAMPQQLVELGALLLREHAAVAFDVGEGRCPVAAAAALRHAHHLGAAAADEPLERPLERGRAATAGVRRLVEL